jgi:hypothetical protein
VLCIDERQVMIRSKTMFQQPNPVAEGIKSDLNARYSILTHHITAHTTQHSTHNIAHHSTAHTVFDTMKETEHRNLFASHCV